VSFAIFIQVPGLAKRPARSCARVPPQLRPSKPHMRKVRSRALLFLTCQPLLQLLLLVSRPQLLRPGPLLPSLLGRRRRPFRRPLLLLGLLS